MTPKADRNKAVLMSLIHDIGEGRTSDLNYVHQRYGRLAERNAVEDISRRLPFGSDIKSKFDEYEERQSLESKLVKDADQLEWIATLREEETKGNKKAKVWAEIALKRLKTDSGKKLGKKLMTTKPDAWWFDKSDEWFVDRDPKEKIWKK